jgi:cell wall-associated NlpC family hydrolase
MAASDADAAARLIERLLDDSAFRADFRRDPAAACRAAGLDELAEEMAFGAGKAMQTLEVRESRSSLAGVMMAAALEGIGAFGFAQHVLPAAAAAPGAVRDVLSRVNLPKVDVPLPDLRGALAQAPPVPAAAPGAGASAAAADAGAPAPAAAAVAAPVASPTPAPTPAAGDAVAGGTKGDAAAGGADAAAAPGDTAASGASDSPAAVDARPQVAPPAATAEDITYEEAAPDKIAPPAAPVDAAPRAAPVDAAQASAASVVDAQPPGAPVDPAQFGAEGSGGPPDAAALALLENKNVMLDPAGVADIKAGRIDPRVVAVLTKISERHKISVSCMCSDHPKLTTGGSVSNHHLGRGIDISAIDGVPVNADNAMAHEVAADLASLDPSYRPTEIGTPWAFQEQPPYFSDARHSDHIHVAFDAQIKPSWMPSAAQPVAIAATPLASVTAPGAPGPDASDTLSFNVSDAAGTSTARNTLSVRAGERGGIPRVAAAATADAAGASAAADLLARSEVQADAGAKALSAVAEALKYKGTDYHWGGSNPDTGFDCSGLVQWAYARQGIQIPRVSEQQILANNGSAVDRKDLVPGDLVFFRDPSGDVHHVGISLGGDKFLHAPHTGDKVKESSLDEQYYAEQFTGGRRFDDTPMDSPAAMPAPVAVDAAHAALSRDAAAARNPGTLVFRALSKQEASFHSSTVQFMPAVRPEDVQPGAPQFQRVAAAATALDPAGVTAPFEYPGDGATKAQLAAWLAAQAQQAGLPRELPVMAALVESGVANLKGGDADSAGFFQMRVGVWDKGAYLGYRDKPELQMKWFIDQALAVKQQRLAAGDAAFGTDPSGWGNWIADIERPLESLRGRYQEQLTQAQALLGTGTT